MSIYKVEYITTDVPCPHRVLYTDINFEDIKELITKQILHSSTALVKIVSARLIKADIYKVVIDK